jgi:predicted extracellular nuclease
LEEVDIIVYALTLTKSGHLRKSTIHMMKEKLKMRSTKKVCRQTRSSTHDPADVGLHLDEDNTLINSSEKNESSNMSISGSNSED